MSETISTTKIAGLLIIKRPTFSDDRGFFRETFRANELKEMTGQDFVIAQENHARSSKLTLRGIHIAPWNKLLYVVRGKVQVVLVDCRVDSPTFGQYYTEVIGDDNRAKIWLPKGCGNAYLVLSDEADYTYMTDDYWAPGKEGAVAWDDPDLGVKWQLDGLRPILSDKDKQNPSWREVFGENLKDG